MDFGDFGWRDAVLLVAVLAAIYFVVALLGLARLRRRSVAPPPLPPSVTPLVDSPAIAEPDMPSADPTGQLGGSDPSAQAARTDADIANPFAAELAAQVARTQLESEVRQLRTELTALREEMAEIRAMRRVSPLYAEAAALAQRGFDARGVAEECGISVAEAELVLAMSRDNKDFDIEVDDGANPK